MGKAEGAEERKVEDLRNSRLTSVSVHSRWAEVTQSHDAEVKLRSRTAGFRGVGHCHVRTPMHPVVADVTPDVPSSVPHRPRYIELPKIEDCILTCFCMCSKEAGVDGVTGVLKTR